MDNELFAAVPFREIKVIEWYEQDGEYDRAEREAPSEDFITLYSYLTEEEVARIIAKAPYYRVVECFDRLLEEVYEVTYHDKRGNVRRLTRAEKTDQYFHKDDRKIHVEGVAKSRFTEDVRHFRVSREKPEKQWAVIFHVRNGVGPTSCYGFYVTREEAEGAASKLRATGQEAIGYDAYVCKIMLEDD